MKRYLLTWYGITDLRAALGLEATDGPILGTLKTGHFSEVVILAYTNPGKDQNAFIKKYFAQWKNWRATELESRLAFPRDKAMEFVDAASNTEVGHEIFTDWLNAELNVAGIVCNVKLIPQSLRQLNDAQGIYVAATSALKTALGDSAEKELTVFVSPGTPVMAYTWALLARANPQHNIFVIASSDARKPPEIIDLPKELLMPKLVAPQTSKPTAFDVVIHLLGRERIPVYFGMLQFQAKEHVFITTKEFSDAAKHLARLLPRGSEHKIITISSAFQPGDTRKAIEKHVGQIGPEATISVNLTGGTKLMFAGALSACWELGIEPFYFEINHHDIIFIRDGSKIPFVGAKSVADFFAVNGFKTLRQGRWNDQPCSEARLNVTRKLWEARKVLGNLYTNKDFRSYKPSWGKKRDPLFDWRWKNSQVSFSKEGKIVFKLEGEIIDVPDCDDFGRYLGGGWLEEYAYSLLRQLEHDGLIYDLRIGMEVDYADKSNVHRNTPVGEFDCVFTDGKRLWIIECKAGYVKQDHIQKLENNLKTYGGIAAKGILISSFSIDSAHVKRVSSSPSMCVLQSNELSVEALRDAIFT